MSFTYSVFGITVRSTAPIPGLIPLQASIGNPDIELSLGCSASPLDTLHSNRSESVVYKSAYTAPSGAPALRILQEQEHGLFHLVYFDGMQFWMDRHGTKLWASWPSESSVEEAATYILGPVLGLLLRFRGITCLHASAVAIGGSVIAFVGAEGAGKSTTAAAFARAGYAAVSDDVVRIGRARGRLLCFALLSAFVPLAGIGGNVVRNEPMPSLLSFQIGKNAAFLLQMVALASRMAPCLFERFISWMRFAMSQVPLWKASPGRWAFSHSSPTASLRICSTAKCARVNSKPFRAWLRRSRCDAYSQAKASWRPPIYARQCSMTSAP